LKLKSDGKNDEELKLIVNQFLEKISIKNINSQSNGSLMRIAPMGFFTAIIKDSVDNCERLIRSK
jgi:ADP-ribosylglycohydrolase